MVKRDILEELSAWAKKIDRKPFVLRGARQAGFVRCTSLWTGPRTHMLCGCIPGHWK